MSVLSPVRSTGLSAAVDAENLKTALRRVQPAVGGRHSSIVNRSVRIQATERQLQITAGEVDFSIRTRVSGHALRNGVVVVPFRGLYGVVSHMRGDLHLHLEGGRLMVEGAMRAALLCRPAREFPVVPRQVRGVGVVVDVGALRGVLPAAHQMCSHVLLTGTEVVGGGPDYFHVEPLPESVPRCYVPRSVIAAVVDAGGEQVKVRVDLGSGRAQFVGPETDYIVRLADTPALGDPRDVSDLLVDRRVVAVLRRKDLVTALKRFGPLLARQAPVWLAVEPTSLTLSMSVPGVGSGSVAIPAAVCGVHGSLDIPFDPARLGLSVAACSADRVAIHLRDARTSAVVVDEGSQWPTRTGLRVVAPDRRTVVTAAVAISDLPALRSAEQGQGAEATVISIERARARRSGNGLR